MKKYIICFLLLLCVGGAAAGYLVMHENERLSGEEAQYIEDNAAAAAAGEVTRTTTKLIAETYDEQTKEVSKEIVNIPSAFLGLTRTQLIEKLAAYMEDMPLEELNSGLRLVPTDYFRIIMALSAMGKDPTDFEGINILERMYDYNNLSNYTSNMMSFTLMAYDSMDFEIPQDAMWSREKLIDMILAFQNQENGGFGLADNKTVSVDMTAMALQALVPYNTDQYPKVQAAFEKGLDYLRGQMLSDCGFYVEGANNGCSAAQVLMLLCEAGIDPLDPDNGFVRDGATLITKLNDFKLESGYTTFEGSSTADGMATYQIGCALESYRRFAEGENRLFDLTDVARQDQAEIDKIAASETEDLISAIGEVTAESGEAIRKARRAYDLLSEDQKALVNNYDVLLAAEEQFALLSGDGSGSQNGGTSADASGSSGGSDAESTIPKTSDRNDLYGPLAGLVISAASILLLRKRKAEKNCGNMM